jgi:hypothetical protein
MQHRHKYNSTLVLASTALAAPEHAATCAMDLAPPPHKHCSTRFMA